jgi:hypothetical protein
MRRTAITLAALATAVAMSNACGREPTVAADTRAGALAASQAGLGASVNQQLASLRQATAAYHDFDQAVAAGWSAQITPCMADPTAGGMGLHYGNVALIDGSVQVNEPELLLYEPEQNGRLRLVAVEYIIPYAFHARDAEPPTLFGQEFARNDVFQLWGLHAWVWKENPSGMFAAWNPTVTCGSLSGMTTMAHG